MSSITRIVSAVRKISDSPYEIELISWSKLIHLYKTRKLDLKACYQRGADSSPNHWKSNLVGGLLQRNMPIIIAVRKLPNGKYEVMDGLQRIITMILFLEGKIRTPMMENGQCFTVTYRGVTHRIGGKTKKEIESTLDGKSLIKAMLDANVISIEYKDLSDDQASQIFIKLNDNTDLNPTEKLNGHHGVVTALARLLARGLDEKGNIDLGSRLKMLGAVQAKPGRLVHDDFAYRCMLMEMWKLDPGSKARGIFYGCCDVLSMREMVTGSLRSPESADTLKKIEREIRRRDKVILNWIKLSGSSKKPIHTKSLWDLLTLYQLTHVMEHKFGKNYKIDPTFATNLFVALTYLTNKQEPEHRKAARFEGERTAFESLKQSTRPELVAKKLQMILDRVGTEGVTSVDPSRVFEPEEIYTQWVSQNKRCAVTGLPLEFEDAVGGHRNAHSDGYRTDAFTNLVVVHKTVNAKMGSKSYDEYMAIHYPSSVVVNPGSDLNPNEKISHNFFAPLVVTVNP